MTADLNRKQQSRNAPSLPRASLRLKSAPASTSLRQRIESSRAWKMLPFGAGVATLLMTLRLRTVSALDGVR